MSRGLGLAVALAFGAFLLSAWSVRDAVWVTPDAANYGIVARSLLAGDGYTENVVPVHAVVYDDVRHLPELHGLLRPVVLAPILAAVGERPLALRLPGLLYVALTGVVVFLWGRRLFGMVAGLLACLLTVTNVHLLNCGVLASDDAGLAFWITSTLAALDHAIATGRERHIVLAGVLAALALLEKQSAVILGGAFLAAPFLRRHGNGPGTARFLGLLSAPLLVAAALYLLRNALAGGSLALRLGPLQAWILRAEGYEGMMRIFDHPPALVETLRGLGAGRVWSLVMRELGAFATAFWPARPWIGGNPFTRLATPAFLPALGLVAMALLARRHARTAVLSALTLLAAGALLGLLWHVELRFLSFVVPLTALWVSGLLAHEARRTGALRGVSWVLLAGIATASTWAFVDAQRTLRSLPDLNGCRSALAYLVSDTGPEERVLTFDPWFTTWATRRVAVMIPTGGAEELATIARRYDTHLLLLQPMSSRPQTSRKLEALVGRVGGLRLTPRFVDGVCRVHRLTWDPPA